ncbi:MAG: hypothetical protein RIS57_769 [Actinomycetota bacterium]|jgi:uncharacterized membrane protein YhaH (DUF805 family)
MRKHFLRLNIFLLIGFMILSLIQGIDDDESLAGMVFFALLIPFILFLLIANLSLMIYIFVKRRIK